ncbi:MAG: flagellar biosynthetic protein FliO [Phyllobacteriaceae bacterium]|nr:flagellar biosynthetic protein FliO [Phyllobacteriaceae bacterium]
MNWINDTLGTELSANVQLGIMFVALLLALLVILWLFRRIFGSPGARVARSRQPRLGVVEAAVVDDTRRLVLVRRDNVEHLLMIGGPGDVVVETNIARNAPAQAQTAQSQNALAKTPGQETPVTTPREPRLIEPVADTIQQVAAQQPPRREIIPQAAAGATAVTGAAAMAGETLDEIRPAAGEAAAEAMQEVSVEMVETPSLEVETDDTAAAVEELAQELTGDIDAAIEETIEAAEHAAALDETGGGRTDTEEDMQKLLDELAGAKN